MPFDIDELLAQINHDFWGLATAAANPALPGSLEDRVANAFTEAVRAAMPKHKRGLQALCAAFIELDFRDLPETPLIDFRGHEFESGRKLLVTVIEETLMQMVWQRYRLIAMLLKDYFGVDFGREIFELEPVTKNVPDQSRE